MGVAGIQWGPYPCTIHSFLINLNEEALLKVSFKNVDWFQISPFSKTTGFSKKALKTNKFWKIQKKIDFFTIWWLLGPFLKKQCLWKMVGASIKQEPRPSTIPSFLVNLNEEALLKVSFKNIDLFQICPFSKTTAFSKKGPKNQQNLKN